MIEATVNLRDLDVGLFKGLREFARDLRPAFRAMRKPVLADQRDHRKKREAPGGKWPARAAATQERYRQRRRGGKKAPRTLLGRLPAAITTRIERDRMIVESRAKWSRVQAEGGRVGHGARIPGRKFLWISRSLRADITKVILERARKVWR